MDDAAVAAEAAGTDAPPASSLGGIWTVLRALLALAIVAAAVYGVVYFLRRIARPVTEVDPYLKVLAGAPLGGNRFVHVVALGSKAWLVGSGDSGVNLIAAIEDQETVDQLMLEDSRRSSGTGKGGAAKNFAAWLRRFGAPGAPAGPADLGASAEAMKRRRERLRGL